VGSEVGLSTTSQMGDFQCLQNRVNNSENVNCNSTIDEGCNEEENVVEIGANRQSCEPSITLLFKLVLEVVSGCEKLVRRH